MCSQGSTRTPYIEPTISMAVFTDGTEVSGSLFSLGGEDLRIPETPMDPNCAG